MIDDTQKLWFACTLCGEDDKANAGENSGEHLGRDGLCKWTSEEPAHTQSALNAQGEQGKEVLPWHKYL